MGVSPTNRHRCTHLEGHIATDSVPRWYRPHRCSARATRRARLLRRIATAELGTFSQRATPARCGRERSGVSRQKRRAGRRQGDQGGAAEAKRERHAAPVHPVHPAHPTHPAHPPGNRSNARGGGEGSRRAAYRSCFASAAPSPPPSLSASLCSRHRLPSRVGDNIGTDYDPQDKIGTISPIFYTFDWGILLC